MISGRCQRARTSDGVRFDRITQASSWRRRDSSPSSWPCASRRHSSCRPPRRTVPRLVQAACKPHVGLRSCTAQDSTRQHKTAQDSARQHKTAQDSTRQHGTVQRDATRHCATLHDNRHRATSRGEAGVQPAWPWGKGRIICNGHLNIWRTQTNR